MMTEVTTGFARTHASETRAGLHPCALAIGAITSRIFQVRSLSTIGKSYSVRRESAGFWFIADLSLLYQRVESAKRLFDRSHGIVAVDLVEVDMVGLQSSEASLHSIHDVTSGSPDII